MQVSWGDIFDQSLSSDDFLKSPCFSLDKKLGKNLLPDPELDNSQAGLNLLIKQAIHFNCSTRETPENEKNEKKSSEISMFDILTNQNNTNSSPLASMFASNAVQSNNIFSKRTYPGSKRPNEINISNQVQKKEKVDEKDISIKLIPDIIDEKENEININTSNVSSIQLDQKMTCDSEPVTPILSSPRKLKTTSNEKKSDDHILKQREKQIMYGKNTPEYKNYISLIPKDKRLPQHPSTPDVKKTIKYSKRRWDGCLSKWRSELHQFDPPKNQ